MAAKSQTPSYGSNDSVVDDLVGGIHQLSEIVKNNHGMQGLQRSALTKDFSALLEQQKMELLGRANRLPGFHISSKAAMEVKGRYSQLVKDFAEYGESSFYGIPIKAIDFWLAYKLLNKANSLIKEGRVFPGEDRVKSVSQDLQNVIKAMTATGVGIGDELVPNGMDSDLWNDLMEASGIFADLPGLAMTSDPMDIPLLTGMVFRKGVQGVATTSSSMQTGQSQLTATEILAEVDWSYSLEEDAAIAMMPAFRMLATRVGAGYMDAFALNADATDAATGNINSDDEIPVVDSYYLTEGQDGIRHQFLVNAVGQGLDVSGAAIDDTKMAEILAKLGKYGTDLKNLRIVPDVKTFLSMLHLDGVRTIDEYGPYSSVVPGEMGKYLGIPIIPSQEMPRTEADGKVSATAANNTKGQLAAYHRDQWKGGQRRGITVEFDRDIQKRTLSAVVSFRIAVGTRGTRADQVHTAGGFNIL